MADYDSRKRKPPEYLKKGAIHMKKMFEGTLTRRILSLALSMAMVLSVLPAGALAEEGENTPPSCTCKVACAETVNESCQVCSTEVGQCAAVQQQEPVQQESEQEQKTETCAHGNDPETCEACASAKKVAQVQAQIDALPEDVTAENKEAAQSALSAVDTAKAELTAEQQTQLDMTRYTALTQKLAALESPAPSTTEKTTEKTAKVITAWEWDDGYEIVDEESGYLILPFTGEEFTASFEEVKGMLPEAILVDGETLPLETWAYASGEAGATVIIDSESCPSPGIFQTTLPEGYVLADGTNVLSLTVALSAGSSEDTSSYADSDTLTNVSYYDADGALKTCPSATKVVENMDKDGPNTTWTTGWYVVEGTVKIGGTIYTAPPDWTQTEELYKSVSVQGDVNLILKEGSELQMLHGHIDVPEGSSLTVYCDNTSNSGTLKVWGAINHAAIGGSLTSPNSGRITINGGTVTASTGNGGAGIGSGEGGSAGNITINGGNIKATANNGGAGIGTGKNGKSATITINNCYNIYARSSGGAGIGSGEGSSGDDKVTVNIHGGKIDAHGRDGAGIGSGKNAPLSVDVNINGGYIYAETSGLSNPASHGAAIGGGYGATNTTVNIGGTAEVDAHGGENAPGIGSIDPGGCSVTISDGTVRAWGGTYGAGIGGGSLKQTSCPVTITGGTVTAYGGDCAAGIGSGYGDDSKTTPYSTGTIIISGGTVTANGKYFAAGIGGGAYCTAGQIQIDGGTVIANRDASKDGDIFRAAFDIGDGATDSNMKKTYARYTLNGSAKLYLQNGYKEPNVQDAIKPLKNSGYIFSGTPETYTAIRVYGSQTLNEDFCIDTGKTMTVMSGASLNANSKLYVKGTLAKEGTGSASGNIYYPLTLTNCTAGSNNTSLYNDELFGKANAAISLTTALQSGYKLDSWKVTPDTVTVSNNSFTMPQQATTVEAKGTQVLQITTQPQADTTIIYGQSATLSVTAEKSSSITSGISYQWYKNSQALSGKTSNTLSLSNLDAGSYSFSCEVACDGITVKSNTATVTVNKAQGSVTINSAPDKTYDGTPFATLSYTVSGSGYPKIEYKLQSGSDTDYTTKAPIDAGSYTVRVTMLETQNFKEASDTKNFTILKATDNAWGTEPSVAGFTYGDNVTNPVTYEATYGNGNVVVTYKKHGTQDTPFTTVPTEAGTYDVKVTLEETNNYGPKLEATNLTLTIAKAASSVTTAPTDAQSLYTGSPVLLVNAGTVQGGTMHYSLDGVTWSADIPTATDWKTYTVYYMVVGDSNHNNIEAQSLTAEIVPFKVAQTQAAVGITYGQDAALSVNPNTKLPDEISYQWYQVTDEGDVELTDATENELTIIKPIADNYTFVCKITCGDYFKYSTVPVEVTPVSLENVNLSGYWAEGGEREIAQSETVELTNPSSRLLTQYTEGMNAQSDPYPSGMKVFVLNEDNQPEEIPALENLLQYSGCSIRITGKPGIRMITSLTKEAKELLKKGELAGYTLEEYGTVVAWDNGSGDQPLTLSTGNSNFAYRKGVSDPVFANVGNLTQYTNVLVWDSLTDAQLAQDILMRPYIILSKDGETVTLYGGTVSRSIGYVAQQNANTFPVGSAGYNYVHNIIDKVANLNQSNESTTTAGGNGE